MVQMTSKKFIDYFVQDVSDPASILIAIEELTRFMKKEHSTEINIYIGMT